MLNKLNYKKLDYHLLSIIGAIIGIGFIMMLSASYDDSLLLYKQSAFKQFIFIIFGCMLAALIINFDSINFIKKNILIFYGSVIVLLVLVFIPPIGSEVNGSERWIHLPFDLKLQPSEIAKLITIISMARILSIKEIRTTKGTIYATFALLPIVSLIISEVDFGATVLIFTTSFVIMFVAGAKKTPLIIELFVAITVTLILLYFSSNRSNRIMAFFDGTGDMDYQRQQSLIGIVRGDWLGTGIGFGIQKITKLSEAHTDMIFSVIGEETGIIGMLLLLLLYLFIFYKGFIIARQSIIMEYRFNSYLAFGITTWLSLQVIASLLVNLSLVPPKGFTLPLISYGGSSIVISIISLAILLKIDIENKLDRR